MTAIGWPKIAVIGAGAVGGYFGGLLARAGASVILIGRRSFVDAVKPNGLFLDAVQFQERISVEASDDLASARDADIVLFCVKTTDTAQTARALAKVLASHAVIVSMQNGVDNAEQIEAASGLKALPAAVYVAASVPAPGAVKHVGRGDIVLGPQNEITERVAAVFTRAHIPCRISENLAGELWTKLVWNCALNAMSALGKVTYGEILASTDAKQLLEATVYEVVAVANASGIKLAGFEDPRAALVGGYRIAEQMAATRSSTAQDMMRGKKTEIDSLNGFIVRRGKELGIPVPVNHALFTLVKLAEGGFKS
jgi:2-dehydropantoate 2-reductase